MEVKKGVLTTTLKKLVVWAEKNALTAMPVSLGCCSSFSQVQNAGISCVFNPHHADVLILSGALSVKSAPVVREIYNQMPSPKYVIAFGSCACSGGLFSQSYAVVSDVSKIIPVDVFVPGCPPSKDSFLEAINALKQKIDGGQNG